MRNSSIRDARNRFLRRCLWRGVLSSDWRVAGEGAGAGGLQENGVVSYNVGYSVICGIADILPLRVSAKYDIVHV